MILSKFSKKGDFNYLDKIILANNSEFEIEVGSSLSDIRVLSQTKKDMLAIWELLTSDNLKTIQIQNNEGSTYGVYENLILDHETSSIQKDGTILTSFSLREKTEIELLREEINTLKEGQEVQDGAIIDLGTVVNELTEEGGTV